MSTSQYDTAQYLLDRANIHDTVTKMYLYLDQLNFDGLATEVFAEEIRMDYSKVTGAEPSTLTGKEQAVRWQNMTSHLTDFQHILTGLLINLPQPGEAAQPTNAEVIGNSLVVMRRDNARGDKLCSSGGRSELKLIKENVVGNPWRISGSTLVPIWISGNVEVTLRSNAKLFQD